MLAIARKLYSSREEGYLFSQVASPRCASFACSVYARPRTKRKVVRCISHAESAREGREKRDERENDDVRHVFGVAEDKATRCVHRVLARSA